MVAKAIVSKVVEEAGPEMTAGGALSDLKPLLPTPKKRSRLVDDGLLVESTKKRKRDDQCRLDERLVDILLNHSGPPTQYSMKTDRPPTTATVDETCV